MQSGTDRGLARPADPVVGYRTHIVLYLIIDIISSFVDSDLVYSLEFCTSSVLYFSFPALVAAFFVFEMLKCTAR